MTARPAPVTTLRPASEAHYTPEAEADVIGACLVAPSAVASAIEALSPDDFYDPKHREMFTAIRDLYIRGKAVDVSTVATELRGHADLDSRAWKLQLVKLTEVPNPRNVATYAGTVRDDARRRQVTRIVEDLQETLKTGTDTAEIVELLALHAAALQAQDMDRSNRLVDGASFALEAPPEVPTIWGRGGEVGWAQGEALILVGPAGIGKTTLMQRLVLARIGVGPGRVLGFPVERADRPVLYVAADRPRQASRSLHRMVDAGDRGRLAAMLKVWRGPLPFDVGADPGRLARWAKDQGAGTIAIDSLKDVALDLAKDDAGSRVARAIQETAAAGLELVVSHHQRKAQGENRKPTKIDDVYGSTWITAVAGSVVLLWGKAGDPLVELSHLKQPAGEIGPLRVVVNHDTGDVDLAEGTGPLGLLRAAPHGLSVSEVAGALFADGGTPDKNQEMKARRKLQDLQSNGLAYRKEGTPGHGAIRSPDRYFATPAQGELGS